MKKTKRAKLRSKALVATNSESNQTNNANGPPLDFQIKYKRLVGQES